MTDFQKSLNHSLRNKLAFIKDTLNLMQVEIGPIQNPLSIVFYEKWLAGNNHGSMSYLNRHLEFKRNPRLLGPNLNSVISVSQHYFPVVQKSEPEIPARVALYARNDDYHKWVKQKLFDIIEILRTDFPNEVFLPYVDSGPVLERELAYRNGLGWFGKNTCLIHPKHGSLFFIAEILTSVNLSVESVPIEPIPDFCGTCQKCIAICPTNALIAPRNLKADQCISYLTIEAKTPPPLELRKKMGDWFFGCDLCQTACPWNEKVFRQKKMPADNSTATALNLSLTGENKAKLIHYFRFLLSSSHNSIQKYHRGSPLSRAGAKGLIRNALIVIANQNLSELKDDVAAVKTPELKELASWTLSELSS